MANSDGVPIEVFQQLTLHRVGELRAAVAFTEQAIATHLSYMQSEFSDVAMALPRSVASELAIRIKEEVEQVQGTFTRGIRAALFVYAWSTLEVDLNQLCEIIAIQRNLRLRPNDLSGKGIARSRNFLTKVLDVPFPDQQPVWENITRLNELRNVIVHRDSRLQSGGDRNLRQFLFRWPSVEVKSEDLYFSAAFLSSTIDTFEVFWTELFSGLQGDG